MTSQEKLYLSRHMVKLASPRWFKVFSALPNEAAKINWIRKFIPKNVGDMSINKHDIFALSPTNKVPINRLFRAVSNDSSTAYDLVSKFKDAHREILRNPILQTRKSFIDRSGAAGPGTSWLRDHNRLFAATQKIDDPNKLIPFSHGGGLNSIDDFLKGRGGYLTDAGVRGIMVTPHALTAGRTPMYAARASSRTLETPVDFSGYIPAKYLKGSRNTGYEASIPTKYYDKIVQPNVQQLGNSDELYKHHSQGQELAGRPIDAIKYDNAKFKERIGRATSLKSMNIISNL